MEEVPLSDPSDWLQTKLPEIYQLDSMLRCYICKEFMNAPVLTGCGHSFCSFCIRSAILYNGKCPLCNEEQIESRLRKNLLLDQVIKFFKNHTKDLQKMLTKDEELSSDISKDDIVELDSKEPDVISLDSDEDSNSNNNINNREKRKIFNQSIKYSSRKKQKKSQPPSVTEQLRQREPIVECPICHEFMAVTKLEGEHIDFCLSKDNPKNVTKLQALPQSASESASESASPRKITQNIPKTYLMKSSKKYSINGDPSSTSSFSSSSGKLKTLSSFLSSKNSDASSDQDTASASNTQIDRDNKYQIQKNSKNLKKLMKLDFNSLSTSKLKEKLSTLSLSTVGTRQQLELRYNQYSILFNSNLDSLNPVSEKILKRDLTQWEFLNNNLDDNMMKNKVLFTNDHENERNKSFDRKSWSSEHNNNFNKLTKLAKAGNIKKADQNGEVAKNTNKNQRTVTKEITDENTEISTPFGESQDQIPTDNGKE
ncbi:hypothetical protein PACTADRAFT_35366 [Pachysolen tannophilus NRRL Y-2460]|uniref:Postreplication repair E3 ubiquitin-protein ligase RAD18 n=1 Tax=Pachysolen tannophilus NRRL Y-2460 TaxID=669874 RepID=A0A1E4TPB8_PACTA|nr:hypothetical protein PACTADRAFT_35366 [Pachysolen tannophilus NRRL Y-2460]